MPNSPPSTPRSRTWNHGAFTLTMLTAPKLWKYMLMPFRISSEWWMLADSTPGATPRNVSAMSTLAIAEPPVASSMVARPPKRSVSGPLMRKPRP